MKALVDWFFRLAAGLPLAPGFCCTLVDVALDWFSEQWARGRAYWEEGDYD